MITYPEFIDPVLLAIGPLQIHWYGVMYLIGFLGGWWLGRVRAAKPGCLWSPQQVDDIVFYIVLGVVLGGRVGSVLFYGFSGFLADPLSLFRVWEGGMSFHGGLIGVLLAMWLFARRHGRTFFDATDFIAPLVTIGLGTGRLGNFINAELWGGPTNLPWGMRVPCADAGMLCSRLGMPVDAVYSLPVHPSQLYEFLLEGVLLFLVLWFFSAKGPPRMAVSGLFLLCYGVFRFLVELVRMPDAHIGYLAFDWVTMGQLLSAPMILFGILLLFLAYRSKAPLETTS
ncbi:MAG: prolipoprotein diacylglyceryl transferase [Candidatus Thiodiazotropha sp. (ex Semelilucina semeliformis)]|nr:prolipoprotein diacylglyceryl transferase [Candidatus Thiodiazotropha sp. (ex Myrtea spinifera)]MCU7808837.1 prolipoprotein diacylglyceryl transferase [Candidatus Thiodiazotropha sp. (ex Semelilucina semeliformis)]MCU7828926.1 prolipoprotein diacylglyceryl transferase [Candidatus Thiodiazotropha sp. (ex Myrtea sp. 'scaly one' KF741663)]